ncbi:MAG: DUF1294 domain-containing protein [Methanomicrobiales archaeon]|nr:DUF1294 domain-containing protein [Methanomicrobiales archaeon]
MADTLVLIICILYAVLNILACGAFAFDKLRAKSGAWRIPESTLLSLAALGPFGAVVAMNLFRHKTRHGKFLLVYLFCLLHGAAIFWILPRL